MPTHLIGSDAFQECDTVGITRACTKHNYLVKDVNDLARVLHAAFHIATTGRPGPVVVAIPKDVQFKCGDYLGPQNGLVHPTYQPQTEGDPARIEPAASAVWRPCALAVVRPRRWRSSWSDCARREPQRRTLM